MKWFKFDKSSVINSLIATAVWTGGNFLLNIKKGDGVLEAFVNTMTLEIRLWHVIVFVGVVYIISVIRGKYKKDAVVDQEVPITKEKPKYLEYTKDKIKGLNWTWEWEEKADGSYIIKKLTPLCPKDHTLMLSGNIYSNYTYKCPTCNIYFNDNDLHSITEGIIRDNIYKKHSVQINI